MFCSNCGNQIDNYTQKCGNCGQVNNAAPGQQPGAPLPHVPSYLAHAILTTLFCCMPFGVVSIVYAAQVNSKLISGDVRGAKLSSDNARKWAWISFWCQLIPMLLYLLFLILFGILGAAGAIS